MKISSVSKKVLASALSAAMVVAFAPTVAFAAEPGNKVTVKYDLAGGVDANSGQDGLDLTQEYTVGSTVIDQDITASIEKYYVGATAPKADPADENWKDAGTATASRAANDHLYVLVKVEFAESAAAGAAVPEDEYIVVDAFTYASASSSWNKDPLADATGYHCKLVYAADKAGAEIAPSAWDVAEPDCTAAAPYEYVAIDFFANAVHTYTDVTSVKVKGGAVENDANIYIDGYNTANITLPAGKDVEGNDIAYDFKNWAVGYDANGDGDFDDKDEFSLGDYNAGDQVWVDGYKVTEGITLTAYATYSTPTVTAEGIDLTQKETTGAADKSYKAGDATLDVTETVDFSDADPRLTYKLTLTDPAGNVSTKAVAGNGDFNFGKKKIAGAGTWTVELSDSNGTSLYKKEILVGSLELTGGIFTGRDGLNATSQTIYYEATDNDDTCSTYKAIIAASGLDDSAEKDGVATTTYVDAKGNLSTGTAKVAKGAIETTLTAVYGNEAMILSAKYEKNTIKVATVNAAPGDVDTDDVKDPAKAEHDGFYVAVTDAEGKVVAESVDTDTKANQMTYSEGTYSLAVANLAGTYTVTLYKVKKAAAGAVDDSSIGSMTSVATATFNVDALAAPTWSYELAADGKTGTITVADPGEGFEVYLNNAKYNFATTGKVVDNWDAVYTLYTKATDKKADPSTSKTVTLVGYDYDGAGYAVSAIDTYADFADEAKMLVSGETTEYYSKAEGVKAAIDAGTATFKAIGFKAQTTDKDEWKSTIIESETAVLQAVAEVAQSKVDALYAGVAATDGTVTKLSTDNYEKAVAAIAKVVADFAANHDGDTANNVAKNGKLTYVDANAGGTQITYITAIDNALATAQAAAVKYAAADVAAAQAVTDALKAATTGEAAEAAIKAYEALTAAQKELVSAADITAAEKTVADAAAAKAEEEAKKAAEEAAAALVAQQDQAAVNYCNSTKSKTVTLKKGVKKTQKAQTVKWNSKVSASGNVVTYAWKSGSTKIKVAAAGTATLKKGVKAGTYKAKVTVTCGAATRTVNVKFVVK